MVALLAKFCKRSAALTWFNLLSFGLFGLIFALRNFFGSFTIDLHAVENQVHNFRAQLVTLESDINATRQQLQHIEIEITVLSCPN
jgi:hypothetical protein